MSYELEFALTQVEKLQRMLEFVDTWRVREALEFWQDQVKRFS
jgi:hypothetical protein